MKSQINLLNQIQELVLARDEHHQTGDGSRMDALDESIDALTSKLEPQPRALYQRLYKRDHVVMTPMVNGCCAVCGMKLPISQVQQVRLGKTLQTCSSCGRMLFNEEDDAPRSVAEKPARGEPRKTGINRFSAEELVIADLKATTPAEAVRELADAMDANKFVSNPAALVVAAMERESILPTAVGQSLAFPHVRGVEGGGLTLALGVSRAGLDWDNSGEKVHLVFFSVIPTAVSVFYLRLMAGLTEAFSKKENRDLLMAAKTNTELWKAFMKATRYTIR
ncbi:MAG: PTS sugar transporter subunit IIA [Kiritimatiellae bacterium]|nr:PTS sugar transporter subunit IIA [Kiritimatiellia bacterium]